MDIIEIEKNKLEKKVQEGFANKWISKPIVFDMRHGLRRDFMRNSTGSGNLRAAFNSLNITCYIS